MSDRYVLFRLGTTPYGVPIQHVQEVLPWEPVTPVPGTPDWVLGAREVRGQVIPVVDLGRRLQVAGAGGGAQVLVVACQGGRAGLVVDEVLGVLRAAPGQWQPLPASLRNPRDPVVAGIGRLDGELAILLDLAAVLAGVEGVNAGVAGA